MKVYRDDYGIPHLQAGSVLELAYLQGRVTASDRGQQVLVERLRSEGRLASVMGADEVEWDVFARRARLDDTARRCYAALSSETRGFFDAYADGVRSTGIEWQPWSSLGVFQVQHILFGTFPNKMWRAHVERTLGPSAVEWFAIEGPNGSGSNAWALPFHVAGDPHRLLELPGVYQQIRLACPEFDVAGLTFPGVPGVQHFGHAGSVAWAITNAMADYQDLYIEELRATEAGVEARGAAGWEPVLTLQETVFVRDADPIVVDIIETARGPVISSPDSPVLSLRTPARVGSDLGFDALLPLMRATTADEVADALAGWVEPVNSVLIADDTGRVVQLAAGRVPVRDDRNRWVPVPAWDPAFAWRPGWAPMTRTEVASAVNANDRRTDSEAHGIDFAPPARAARIRTLLDAGVPSALIHMDTSMAADSEEAGRHEAWRSSVARALWELPSLKPLFEEPGYDPLFTPWIDPRGRIGHSLDGVLLGLGLDPSDLVDPAVVGGAETWGSRHLLYPITLSGLDIEFPRVELSGSRDCVLNTSSVTGVSDLCVRGPVARYIWDLNDRQRSRWVVPFGAHGDPESPHFLDQLPLWASGSLVPLTTDWDSLVLDRSVLDRFVLDRSVLEES
ncbi:penicillin amidase [Actinoplanes lutulentus]|uniref:Penicillin amidase n=1 Tax=Actinoplanes lutulentus TaxID=1287878 RepID=A0A327Z7Q2_9ACTN|nr:penicillin acylase family protein [Actinoplanes lutulentus]MBB2942477.1 penicillin amidase [Actinoplanes lutulentus]RAK33247.1 penicillin amidase [Actinoplanes lutulentus]